MQSESPMNSSSGIPETFCTKSGNRVLFMLIEQLDNKIGLHASYKNNPSEEDMKEVEQYIVNFYLADNVTSFNAGKRSEGAIKKGQDAYKKWKEST